jgi:hypothetical protein
LKRIPVWSRVVFLALLPFVLYSAWDVVESRRLQSRLDALDATGQLGVPQSVRPPAEALEAERFYRAAAALVTTEKIASRREDLDANREAFDLVDRAAHLPFRGFVPGASYNFLAGDLGKLARALEYRAAIELHDNRADAAVTSFFSEARLMRAFDAASGGNLSMMPRFEGLGAAMSAGAHSPLRPALVAALADLDRDDRLKSVLIDGRARMLRSSTVAFMGPSRRTGNPFGVHIAVQQLDAFASLIAAADAPWPSRIDAVNAVDLWPFGFATNNPGSSAALRNFTKAIAGQVKTIRCARLIASTTPLTVIDPFSGRALEPSQCHL